MNKLPVLYSFRRCPYAIRARFALMLANKQVELREVNLKDKPNELIHASPKATVPVLVLCSGEVIDESLDIVDYALPHQLSATLSTIYKELLAELKNTLTPAIIDIKYKGSTNFTPVHQYLERLNHLLSQNKYIASGELTKLDISIFPLIRQLYRINPEWFTDLGYHFVNRWLHSILDLPVFKSIMIKHPAWKPYQAAITL